MAKRGNLTIEVDLRPIPAHDFFAILDEWAKQDFGRIPIGSMHPPVITNQQAIVSFGGSRYRIFISISPLP